MLKDVKKFLFTIFCHYLCCMKLISNNISPLPFYDSIEQQNHRKDYAFGQIYPLITYRNMLLPFQIILPPYFKNIPTAIGLHNYKTDETISIVNSLTENGLELLKYEGFNVLRYSALLPILEIKHEGLYYIEITFQGSNAGKFVIQEYYSEVFTVANTVDDCLLLEYGSDIDFSVNDVKIDFSGGFKFKCYLNTQIGKPEYVFEEEAADRLGYSFIETQVSKKVYKFTFLAPEYLCDALRIVRLCNYKQIISKGQVYSVSNFSITPEWQEQGDLAAVECEFETDTVIANLGGYIAGPSGKDFNDDFNNDFNRE